MSKLLPCPFCGGEAEVVECLKPRWDSPPHWTVGCKKQFTICPCEIGKGKHYLSETKVIQAWNTRYEPPTPGGAIVPAGNERLEK